MLELKDYKIKSLYELKVDKKYAVKLEKIKKRRKNIYNVRYNA